MHTLFGVFKHAKAVDLLMCDNLDVLIDTYARVNLVNEQIDTYLSVRVGKQNRCIRACYSGQLDGA